MKNTAPPVIYYHSVAPALFPTWSFKWLTLTLPFFEDQMAYLQVNGFRSVFLDEWLLFRRGEKAVSGKEVCLSFDDGLLDNWVYAFPVAKKHGQRFTLFVSPELIDTREIVRPTLEDVWAGRCREEELEGMGYLSWAELRKMQESGVVDVQSHTMTHLKYISSPRIWRFYYGGYQGVHAILNAFPEIRLSYMADPGFEKRLPWGTPLFDEKSAVIARRHTINPELLRELGALASGFDLDPAERRAAYEQTARDICQDYERMGILVTKIEREAEYQARLAYEVKESKDRIEAQLGKPVRFLCWPHGDNTREAHAMARDCGYLATTAGNLESEEERPDRIPRMGISPFRDLRWPSRLKFRYKIASHYGKQPYHALAMANELKNKILG